jgi:hypothetical protein
VLELVDPLQSVAASPLNEEQYLAGLPRPGVDHAQVNGRVGLDPDSNSVGVECAHRYGSSHQVGTIIRELAGLCKDRWKMTIHGFDFSQFSG